MDLISVIALILAGIILLFAGIIAFGNSFRKGSSEKFFDEQGEAIPLPMTFLQKRAWWGLILGAVASVALIAIFADRGVEQYYEDKSLRLAVLGIVFGALLVYGIVVLIIRLTLRKSEATRDERDILVLSWAPRVQVSVMMISLLAWAISLTEIFWERGSVPIAIPILIFWSTMIASLLGWSAGILLGYRRF